MLEGSTTDCLATHKKGFMKKYGTSRCMFKYLHVSKCDVDLILFSTLNFNLPGSKAEVALEARMGEK